MTTPASSSTTLQPGHGLVQGLKALWGGSSWFGGPNDPSSGPRTASGASVSVPGIAVNNRSTLGGYWMIKAPNGDIGIVRQTDIGPASWTGRAFDYTYSLLSMFGYSESNFPTNAQTYGIYLGKNIGANSFSPHFQTALKKLGASAEQSAVLMQSLDNGAIEQGHSAVVAPAKQKQGTQDKAAGQAGGSEAVSAGVNLPSIPGLGALGRIADLLTSGEFWLRLGEALLGVILLAMGLRSLTGSTTTPMSVARAVRP